MARTDIDIYRKAVLDAGISGKNWRKAEAFDEFTAFFNAAYTEEQRQAMKYDAILKISKAWWGEYATKYS